MGWLDCFIVNATRNQTSRAKKSLKSVLFLGNLTEISAKNYQTQKKLASEKNFVSPQDFGKTVLSFGWSAMFIDEGLDESVCNTRWFRITGKKINMKPLEILDFI